MNWWLSLSFIFLTPNFESNASDEKNDKECQESFLCSPSENCPYYQEQISEIRNASKYETKNEILSSLR